MNFLCQKCDKMIHVPATDKAFYEKHEWHCLNCITILADHKYELNIKNGKTLFGPMGFALGDQVIQTVVKNRYEADNPDETVLFAESWQEFHIQRRLQKFDKVFFSNVGGEKEIDGTWFSLCNEVAAFGRQGYFPTLPFKAKPLIKDVESFSVAIHARNIDKAPEKNMLEDELDYILRLLLKLPFVDFIYLVGRDRKFLNEPHNAKIVDFRRVADLEQTADIIHKSNLFIGRDSGLAHVAGAVNTPVIAWNYAASNWFPSTKAPKYCFIKRQIDFNGILKTIKEFAGKLYSETT